MEESLVVRTRTTLPLPAASGGDQMTAEAKRKSHARRAGTILGVPEEDAPGDGRAGSASAGMGFSVGRPDGAGLFRVGQHWRVALSSLCGLVLRSNAAEGSQANHSWIYRRRSALVVGRTLGNTPQKWRRPRRCLSSSRFPLTGRAGPWMIIGRLENPPAEARGDGAGGRR